MKECLKELELDPPNYHEAAAWFAKIKKTTWSTEITEDGTGEDRKLLLAILGLKDSPQLPAEKHSINKAYHRLSLQFHPDKNPDVKNKSVFSMIQTAYEALSKTTLVLSIELAYKNVVKTFSDNTLDSETDIKIFKNAFAEDILKHAESTGEYSFLVSRAAAQKDFSMKSFIKDYFQREADAFLDPKLLALLKKYSTEHPEFSIIDPILTLLSNHNRYFLYRFLKILPEFEATIGEALFLEIFPSFVEYIENTSISSGILFAQLIQSLDQKLKSKLPTIFKNTPANNDLSLAYIYFIEHLNQVSWLQSEDELVMKLIAIANKNPIAARLMISDLSKLHALMGHNTYLFSVFIEIKDADTRHLLLEILSLATKKLQDNSILKEIVFQFFQNLDKRSILYNSLKIIRELPDDLVTKENFLFCYDQLQNDPNNFKLLTLENATAFMHLLSQSQATAIWKMISGGITEKDSKTQTKILVFVTQLKKLSQLYSPELFQQIVDRVNFDDLDQNKMILLLPLLQDLIPEEFEQNIDTLLDPKSNNIDITNYNWSLIRAITQKDWESYAIKELPQVGQQLLDALKKELDKTKEVEKVIGLIKKIFFDYSDSYILAVNPLIEILFFVRRHNRLPIDESQIAFHRWAVNPQSYMKKLPFYASILRCSLLQKEAVNPTLERHRRHGYDTYHLIYNSFNSDGWIASVSDYGHSYQLPTSKNDLVRLLSSIYRHKNLSHIFDYYELNYFSNKGNDENGEWVSVTIARLVLALKAQKFSFLKESSHFIKPHQIDEGILNEWLDMLDIAPDHVRNNAELQAFLNESSLNYDTRAADSLSAFKNLLNSLMANDKEASTASLQCFTKNTHSHLKLLFSALTQNTINRILIENKELFLLFLEFRNNTYSVGGRDYTSCEFLDKLAEQLPLNLSQNVAYLEAILDYSIKRSKSEINRSEIGNDYSIIYELRDLTKNAGWGVGGGSWFSSQMNGRMMFFPGLLIEAMRKFHSDKPYTGFFQVANTISTLSLETLQTQLPQIEGVIRSNDNQDDALNAIQSMKALTAGSATPNEASLERLDFPQEPAGIPTAANNNNQPHNNNVTPHSPVEAPLKAPINQAQIPLKFILSELFNDKLVESKFAHTEQTLKKFFSDKLKNLNQSLSICKDWYKRENIKKDINVVKSMEALTLPAIKELQRIWRTEADPKKRANKLMQLEIKLIRQSAKSNVNKCIALSIIAAALLIGAIVATIFTCGAFGLIAGFSIALSAALSTALASTSAAAGVVGILCIPAAFFQNNQANSKDQAALERNWLIPTASR